MRRRECGPAPLAVLWLILTFSMGPGAAGAGDDLERGFLSPPDSARPWVYWWWLDSNITREGITRDLEEMKRQGIGGALVFDAGEGHTSPVGPAFMSPAWREMFRYAVEEARRLGLQLSFNIASGWDCGGTWVAPEHALKRIVWSQTRARGPAPFSGEIPKPPANDGYFKDVAVLAYRVPDAAVSAMEAASVRVAASSTFKDYAVGRALDGDPASRWISDGDRPGLGPSEAKPESIRLDFPGPFAASAFWILPYPDCGPRDCQLQISQDGTTFQTFLSFTVQERMPQTFAFEEVRARSFRLRITSSYPYQGQENWNVQIAEIQLLRKGEAPRPPSLEQLDRRSFTDLTARLDASGRLEWEVPPGDWWIFRFCQTLYGGGEGRTKCTSRGAQGYEIDFYSAEALDGHFAQTAGKVASDVKDLAGTTLAYFHDDSWECGEPNWTPRMREEFLARRLYDPLPWLAVLAGRTVGDRELSDRFLRDFRRTAADLMAENHYGRFRDLSRRWGMGIHPESGGPFFVSIMDALMNLGRSDIPMGEYWIRQSEPAGNIWYTDQYGTCDTVKQAATAAHIYGKKLCQAEAFTNMGRNWEEDFFMLKAIGDRAFCAGLTRNMLCFYVHQPSLDIQPGYQWPEAGTHFDRNVTWWSRIHAFTGYLSRCQFLLQQGLFVADVCYFAGEDAPCYVPAKTHMKPPLPRGYDCDTVNGEVLGTRLSVRDGRLALPDGITYRLLVLPQRETMTPQVLRKVADLVEAGATVVGPKPSRSPSLQGHPECDREVHTLADRVWGDCDGASVRERSFGKGRVVWGKTIEEVLRADGAPPDFEFEGRRKDADLDFLHRRLGETEIYFVSNQGDRLEEARCTFRVAGRRPELWDAVTGKLRAAAAFEPTDDGRTALPLDLPPRGSLFVVFREAIPPSQRGSGTGNSTALAPVLELKGPWTVAFDPRRGAPRSVEFPELADWTARPEEGIRFYAGTATYRKSFEGPDSPAKTAGPLYLDLGELKNLAEVRLNGTSLGVLWTKPFRAEISKALRAGPNDLEIDIVNLWPNRLIGDQRLPEDRRTTTTNVTKFKKDSPLLPSGLYGPVRILAGAAD